MYVIGVELISAQILPLNVALFIIEEVRHLNMLDELHGTKCLLIDNSI